MGGKEKEIQLPQRGANAFTVSRGDLISNSSRKPLSRDNLCVYQLRTTMYATN